MLSSSAIPVTVAPDANAKLVEELNAPATPRVPVTSTFSANVIFVESAALKVVPFNVTASNTIFPVPDVVNVKSAFVGATRLVIDTSPSAANSSPDPAAFTFRI